LRTMYDGINSDASVIPTSAQLVGGYVDGNYVWSAADWNRFPHSIHVGIAVKSTTNAGVVLDVEKGNATPAESVDWVLLRRKAGVDPTVYCSQSEWPTVRAAFQARKVAEPHYWVANYNKDKTIPAGAIAHQYESDTRWDISSVADYWPGVDAPPTTFQEEDVAQQIESLKVHPDEMAYDVPKGANQIRFGADGYGANGKLRVVVWNGAGDLPSVNDGVLIGVKERYKMISLPPGTTHVTVRREDTGEFPISVGFA